MKKMYENFEEFYQCEDCGVRVYVKDGYLNVYNKDGEYLGAVQGGDFTEDLKALESGSCPVCDGWEDGNGNTCSAEGWEEE